MANNINFGNFHGDAMDDEEVNREIERLAINNGEYYFCLYICRYGKMFLS